MKSYQEYQNQTLPCWHLHIVTVEMLQESVKHKQVPDGTIINS